MSRKASSDECEDDEPDEGETNAWEDVEGAGEMGMGVEERLGRAE